jgi:polyphosphate:AMP phosphotransferase
MFEEAESDPSLTDTDAKQLEQKLRTRLLRAQYQHLEKQDRALLILVGGIDGAGKGDTINLLNDWLDPRHIRTMAFPPPTAEDLAYPPTYRFWHHIPPKGETGIMFGSGYAPLIVEASKKHPDLCLLENMIMTARRYEADLVSNGVQVIKLWFHLSKKAQRDRTKRLLANPSTAWKVGPRDQKVHKHYDRLCQGAQRVIEATDSDHSPWVIIPAADANLRNIRTAQAVLQAFEKRTIRVPPLHDPSKLPALKPKPNPLDSVDYKKTISKDEYETQILDLQNKLAEIVRSDAFKKLALVLVFEGQDAAGKGGTIRRITHALDARQYEIMATAAPKAYELARPYLWRFWRNVPHLGRISIFDRSWYGRVLVERVEKLITPTQYRRAYSEINNFELQLSENNVLVLKFWLTVTPEEQLKRFKEREASAFKQFKITDDDWRNRRKSPAYYSAAGNMLKLTHTDSAPWFVVPSNDKRLARVTVLKHIITALENTLKNQKLSDDLINPRRPKKHDKK